MARAPQPVKLQRFRAALAGLRHTPLHPQWLLGSRRDVERWVAPHLAGTVVDIGCADRWIAKFLPATGHYVGIDSLATGATLYRARPELFADAARLPIADDSVDCVVLLEVLEHLEAPRDALVEIARVLKPGGRLLLSMPFLYPIHDAPHDYQRFTRYGLARELGAVGFEAREIEPTRHALATAGLLTALGLSGAAVAALDRRQIATLLVPLLLVAVPVVNAVAWLAARVLPDWSAMACGYRLVAVRVR